MLATNEAARTYERRPNGAIAISPARKEAVAVRGLEKKRAKDGRTDVLNVSYPPQFIYNWQVTNKIRFGHALPENQLQSSRLRR